MKANPNPAILKILLEMGSSLDTVSPWEIKLALDSGFPPSRILFTGSSITQSELEYCLEQNVAVNMGSLDWLERYGQINPGSSVSIRINPGIGAGHHAHCITGGPRSKFGIYYDQFDQIQMLVQQYNLHLIGIQSHIGTGILESAPMLTAMDMILDIAERFPGLEFIDFGGGFGIPYRETQQALDIQDLGRRMSAKFLKFCQGYGKTLTMKIEPGRFLVAQSGTLLATVNTIKKTSEYMFIGVDSGFNHLIRPTMYGAYHQIYNASCMEGDSESVVIVGNICESGDIFSATTDGEKTRRLPHFKIGDLVAITDTGAYGMSMSSQYNMRCRPAEVMVSHGKGRIIRVRESYEDLVRCFV